MTVDTPDWVRDAVFYQIFPDRFASSGRVVKPGPLEPWDSPPTTHGFKGGDLLGIVERLPYLADLGITALYLTPIFSSASNHRYHTYDYLAVDPMLGGDAALRELLDAAHERGMRVVLDGVFNHTGRGFWPFHHVLETGADSPYRDWFHLDDAVLERHRPLLAYPPPDMPPPARGTSRIAFGYEAWWDLPALPKLDTDHPDVREYLFGVAEHWLRFGIDGWRLDVPAEIDDGPFWQEFRRRCRAINPEAYLVGEIWRIAPDWLRGDRFDALMNYPLGQAILAFAGGASLDMGVVRSHHEYGLTQWPLDGPGFAARLMETLNAYDPDVVAVQLNLLGSHDAPRMKTVFGDDDTAIRLATLLQLSLPGAACIYYGDEIGLSGANDPDCRAAFPWDEGRWDIELLAFTRVMTRLRAAEPTLRHGSTTVLVTGGDAIVYERRLDDRVLLVAVNAGSAATELRVEASHQAGGGGATAGTFAGTGTVTADHEADGTLTVRIHARSGAVIGLAHA